MFDLLVLVFFYLAVPKGNDISLLNNTNFNFKLDKGSIDRLPFSRFVILDVIQHFCVLKDFRHRNVSL